MLEVNSVRMEFGGVVALDDVSFQVDDRKVVGVIGPNGSGKSTLVNVMTGFYKPTSGHVHLDSQTLSGRSPEVVRKRGLARTFQNLRLVEEMSVLDNAVAGLYLDVTGGGPVTLRWLSDFFGLPAARRHNKRTRDAAVQALALVGLEARLQSPVGDLSYAEQKRLELARALAYQPRVLILDEPTAGMSAREAEDLIHMVVELTRSSENPMSLFLVEHRLELVLQVSDRVIVMDGGRLIADGEPTDVGSDPEVRRIYVGGE